MKITLIGGDKKSLFMENFFKENDIDTYLCGFEKIPKIHNISISEATDISDYLILPLPSSRDGVTVEAPFSENTIYLNSFKEFNGKILAAMVDKSFGFCNYYDESLQILNAVPSAEGAILQALKLTDITLKDSNCLIIGYGKIAKVLCRLLKAFGANITVTARKPTDIALAKSENLNVIRTAEYVKAIPNADCIFNMVPYPLLGESILRKCKISTVIIDLATNAGTDFKAAENIGITAVHAKSMPAKTAPKTAALYTAEHILEIINGGMNNV